LGAQSEPSAIIENLDPEKPSFRPSKWPRKFKTAKNSKLPKLPENCFEPVGKGGWPSISTWIRLGFWMYRVFSFMFDVKRNLEPHCTHLLANECSRHISSQR
jgi:hypothetical protein